jgi:uncharacterized protein (DUF1800 family)
MSNCAFALRKRFGAVLCASFAALVCGAFINAFGAQTSPLLFSVSDTSTRAVALETVSLTAEPFSLNAGALLNPNDPRTRITLFCVNLDLLAGETANALTADAEDAGHVHYSLKVEYVTQVPAFAGIYMVVVRLNDSMTGNLGDVLVRLNLHGLGSNRVRIGIGQVGGGPADDNPGVGTPAPQTPPAAVTPLTLAQYQAQFSDPSFASDQDRRRFLEQATWGPSDADLTHLQQVGIQAYLNEQFNAAPSGYPNMTLYPTDSNSVIGGCDATCVRDNYTLYQLQKQFFQNALTGQDQLRTRVAFALHQMIPIAGRDLNNNEASWTAPYLRAMDANAFGNFRNVLFQVTLNPAMGNYLDMAGNSRVAPNENYAREIMQLFSIGVDTLNQDGTPVLDAQGNRVPSYSESTIQNLARVFTGWRITTTSVAVSATAVPDYITPMSLSNNGGSYNATLNSYNGVFDTAPKTLLNGLNLPAAAPGLTLAQLQQYKTNELNAAIDNLFNHPNMGPYLCTQLIHQLVTSNPSGAYVGRCSAAFANNGSGVRGDMKAIITAILLDPEARGDAKTDPNYGHLREPVLLITNLLRTFNATSDFVLASSPFSYTNDLGQDMFNPPTVFSYYPANFSVAGTNLFGPEFGLLDTSTTYRRANFVNTLFLGNGDNGIPISLPNRPTGTQVNYSAYQALAADPTQLVDALNAGMMHGTMSSAMRTTVINSVTAISSSDPAGRTRTAIYQIATSSQYQVER